MERFRFTQGKWVVKPDNNYEEIRGIWSYSDDGFPTYIARTCFAPASEANARLIVAAPEMLALLIEMTKRTVDISEIKDMINKALGV